MSADDDEGITCLPESTDDDQATGILPISSVSDISDHDVPTAIVSPAQGDVTRAGDIGTNPSAQPAELAETSLPPPPDSDVTRMEPPASHRASSGVRRSAAGRQAIGSQRTVGPLEIGQAFGPRYHIIRVLGVGGMGAVYQAWDAELSMAVAVKVIRPEIAADPFAAREIERRFKRELLLARQVTHKNVVRIHDIGEIDGIKYITMPFVDGKDLATILKRETKLGVSRALRIARGIVSGLVSAHEAGVVHRDLKPANIMVGEDDEPTIMDFGIARSAGQDGQGPAHGASVGAGDSSRPMGLLAGSTMAGAIVGTVEYMAPEQAKGQPVDQRADIYAFGLILYDMLIGGRRSERAESAIAELERRMAEAPRAPRAVNNEIPHALDEITLRCLAPDPAKRFQTTVELQAALERLDENGKPLPIIRRLTRRTMTAAAVLVLLLLGATYYTAKWLSVPLKPPDPVSVVIADVQNNTGDPTFDNTIGPTLRRALEDASFISAYDRSRMPSLGVRPPEKLDEVAAREVAVKQGLGVVLAGSIAPYRSGYEISVRATQTVTGDEIVSASARASNKDQVLETAAQLMARVRNVLGDTTSESAQLFAMRSVSASSLEVVSHYAAAVEAQAKGNYEEARQSYLKAVELDPQFGLGYQGLSAMSRNLGQTENAEKYIKEALRYIDKSTERERFATRGYYYRTIGDNQQCVKEYGELLARYPADTVAHNQRAVCFSGLRRMRDALDEMQQAVKMLPNHAGYRVNLALISNLASDFEGAEHEVSAMEQPSSLAVLALAHSQFARGLVQEATASYQKLAAMDPRSAVTAEYGLADLLVYQGRFSDAVRRIEQGVAADVTAKNTDRAAIKLTSIAYAHLMAGRKGPAVTAAEEALQHSKNRSVRFLAGQTFVEAGEFDRARKLAAEMSAASDLTGEASAHGKIIEGEIALKSGDPKQAIKILTDANAILDTWIGHFDLGRAQLAAGNFVQADSEFDLCLGRRGEAISLMNDGVTYSRVPLVYYYQGRVREELKTASFADSYREYLKIRVASTEDPLVADVRRRLGN